MSSFKDYCLDEGKLKSGVRLPLYGRDGKVSKDYVLVRWAWCDKVRAAMDEFKRRSAESLILVTPDMTAKAKNSAMAENKNLTDALVLDCRCTQVAGWSFDEKPTKANVKAFLDARPDTADRIDTASSNERLFFTKSGGSL